MKYNNSGALEILIPFFVFGMMGCVKRNDARFDTKHTTARCKIVATNKPRVDTMFVTQAPVIKSGASRGFKQVRSIDKNCENIVWDLVPGGTVVNRGDTILRDHQSGNILKILPRQKAR